MSAAVGGILPFRPVEALDEHGSPLAAWGGEARGVGFEEQRAQTSRGTVQEQRAK